MFFNIKMNVILCIYNQPSLLVIIHEGICLTNTTNAAGYKIGLTSLENYFKPTLFNLN